MNKASSNSNSLSDTDLKDLGNKLFSQRKYDEAICCYSKAIIKNPTNPTYFTNRALCYLKLKRWDLTTNDCRRALDMDSNHIKGHFFLGSALSELSYYDEALKHLQRAHDLAKENRMNFGDDIAAAIRIARKARWNALEEKQVVQEKELLAYLNRLILEDSHRQIAIIKENKSSGDESDEKLQNKILEVELKCDNDMSELNSIFSKIEDKRENRDIPDHLCGKISFELLRDPVITPSGITYERKDIIEHLQKVGHFDPVTRIKLTADQLIPNYAMKEVIDEFLKENEWAIDY